MPVSGSEESKVLARKSSDISAGIPPKKRRFLLIPPPSPPRNESPHALSEVLDIKSNKESSSDLKHKEESGSDGKEKDESCSVPKNKDEYGEDVKHKEAAGSDVQNEVESPPDLKDKEESLSDQGPSSVANKSPGISVSYKINLLEIKKEIVFAPGDNLSNVEMDASGLKLPEVRPVDELGSTNEGESKTELSLLTGKSAASEVLRNTEGAVSVGVKKEMESRQIDDCNLKLSTVSDNDQILVPKEFLVSGFGYQNTQSNDNDGAHSSLLSLSLSKEVPTLEHKIGDANHSGGKTVCANRSNWDLNTPMDSWEGSTGDAAVQGNIDGSTKKTDSNNGKPSSSSIPMTSVLSEKGKQVISTNEPRSSFPNSFTQLIQNSEDSLRLTLSSSFQEMEFRRTPSGLSANLTYNSRDVLNRQSGFESSINKNKSGCSVVKSEPTDENPKFIPTGTSCSSTELLDFNSLKREHVDKHGTQVLEVTASSSHNFSAQKGIKSEPTSEVCEGICRTTDLTLQQSIGKFVHPKESGSSSSILTMPVTPPNPSPSRLRTSSELSMSADISNQSEHSDHNKEFHFGTDVVMQPDTSPKPVNDGGRGENLAGDKIVNTATEAKNVDDCEMKIVKDHSHDLHVNGEGSVSDEEKISISADERMEDESYESDYESDGNQAFGSQLGKQKRRLRDDDEYEDGEVREHRLHSMTEDPAANGIDAETSKLVCDNNDCPSGHPGDTDGCQVHDKENELKIHDDMTTDHISQNAGVISNENYGQLSDIDGHSQKLSLDGMTATVADERVLCNSYQGKSGDTSGEKSSIEGFDRDIACDGASSGGRIERTTGESKGETVEAVNLAEKPNLSIPTVEASIDGANAAKDSTRGGNRSRIINLPRAAATSPSKSRSIPDKFLSSRNGRERYSDLDGDNIFRRGTRDEMDTDGPHRFVRERIQDHSFRNSRLNYTRGRGRFSGSLETSRSEWGSDRNFPLGNYRDDYRFTRNKRAAVLADAEIDSDDYVVAPDGAGLSTGRERKSLNDDLPSFRHPSSRKFSPGVRDGPAGRGVDMLRRIPRNISPSRRNDENGIGLVGVRDGKFVRVLPDDIIDHAYTRPHTMYEGGDNQFIRGNRNFSSFQRRGFPRVRSKSPVGSRTRSPGSWPSPRRRSPDGFNVLPHIAQHRSPGMYGTRSPERTCFPEQMVARRRGSPSYMARPPPNDSRDVDSGREHGHPRTINPSRRSPSDRVLNRSTRRLDDLDPRIRMSDDEYFARSVQTGRFQEFHADASSDDRRKCSERRGFGRPFRPPYMGETDNSRFHSDDGPRPLRFCSNADTEFTGRNIRERDFDGQMKNRGIVSRRRIRSIDDQEGSYRHAGRAWHDDAFNEGSGFKRRF